VQELIDVSREARRPASSRNTSVIAA